ncbi:MAG: terpene cyclase/mutase family protein, partial [Planctomycetales bacterium]|nr:terpene cyclase/mutase family protein [Planctomycetales bacterium]
GEGSHAVRVTGRVGDRTRTVVAEADFGKSSPGGENLPRLWAARKVGILLEEIRLRGETPEVRAEVVRLSREHGIVTPYTSYLVVEDSEKARVERWGGSRGGRVRDVDRDVDRDVTTHEWPIEDPVLKDAPADHNEAEESSEKHGSGGDPNAVADKPFQGKYWNDSLGVAGGAGGAYGGRFGGKRDLVARGGGGRGTEAAVAAALRWLKKHQESDGSWEGGSGTTSLGLLSFLGAGNSMRAGPYREAVKNGLKYLISVQSPDGCVGPKTSDGRYIFNHAIGTMALSEAYGLSGMTPQLKAPAQKAVEFLLQAQSPYLGWGPGIRTGGSDTTVTGWAVLALHSARLSGLDVPPEAFQGAKNWFDKARDEAPGTVAVAVSARIFMGEPTDSPKVTAGAALLRSSLPKWDPDRGNDFVTWCFGTLAMFQTGGANWRDWNAAIKEALVKTQRRGGDEDGSWDPGAATDRVSATALATLSLEIYYRYGRILGTRETVPGPAAAQDLRSDGAAGIEAGRTIDALKEGRAAAAPVGDAEVRRAGGRTFRREGVAWVDEAFRSEMPVVEVEALSEAWLALSRERPDLAPCLALGDRVTVVVEGKAYRVAPR